VVHVSGAAVSVVAMGSVCTLAEHRQHHFASQMVERAIRDFTPTTSVMLVSGDLSIYRRVGCVDFGDWLEGIIGARDVVADGMAGGKAGSKAGGMAGGTVRGGARTLWGTDGAAPARLAICEGEVDPAAAHRLYLSESLRYSRTVADMSDLLATLKAPKFRATSHPARTFTALREGEVVAYAIAIQADGPSAPVQLLEWAGDRMAVVALADAARQAFAAAEVRIHVARDDQTMRGLLEACQVQWRPEANQGTLRVLNPDLLLQEYGTVIREMFGCHLRLRGIAQDVWQVAWEGKAGSGYGMGLTAEGAVLAGWAELSTWLFGKDGLNLPFARTDDLNYV
ncbi:MAG: hypothetical protein OWU32_14045, partial [Firmicutes bacterium]|nr:hypothetical protein [Bacillota bacterium]